MTQSYFSAFISQFLLRVLNYLLKYLNYSQCLLTLPLLLLQNFFFLIWGVHLRLSPLTFRCVKPCSLSHGSIFWYFPLYYPFLHYLSPLHVLMSFAVSVVFSFLFCLCWIANCSRAVPVTYCLCISSQTVLYLLNRHSNSCWFTFDF